MNRFEGKTALVTGGASGIGAAIGNRLVAEGASVVLLDLNADGLADAAERHGDHARGIVGDVTVGTDVQGAVDAAVEEFGGIDLVFNVAGGARFGALIDIDPEDWYFTVDLILKGTFLTTRSAARAMREAGAGGAIVNISSLNAHVPLYGGSAYGAAKAATENFTKGSALELAQDGIRVNAVLPGLVDTPLTAAFLSLPELTRDFLERIPAGRPASPDEIAGPALFLASDDAAYVNGTSLVVDGAWEISNYPNLKKYL